MRKYENAKLILGQTLLISIGTYMVIGVEGMIQHFQGEEMSIPWYQVWAILLVGFITALPSVVWLGNEKVLPKHPVIKIVVHFLMLYGVISLAGKILNWYSKLKWYLIMSVGFFIVYAMVWLITIWFLKQEEDSINRKLEEIQDED